MANRLRDFIRRSLIKQDNDWRGAKRPQVAVHRNCHVL